MQLHFKFRKATAPDEREKLIAKLVEKGGGDIAPLFPDDESPSLAAIYRLSCDSEKTAKRVLRFLEREKAVEYAEAVPERKLVR